MVINRNESNWTVRRRDMCPIETPNRIFGLPTTRCACLLLPSKHRVPVNRTIEKRFLFFYTYMIPSLRPSISCYCRNKKKTKTLIELKIFSYKRRWFKVLYRLRHALLKKGHAGKCYLNERYRMKL